MEQVKACGRGDIVTIINLWGIACGITNIPLNLKKEMPNWCIGLSGLVVRYEPPELTKEYYNIGLVIKSIQNKEVQLFSIGGGYACLAHVSKSLIRRQKILAKEIAKE